MSEGSKFFEERSLVQASLHKITRKLAELNIPYAVAGGMALFHHGYRRFTEDVDVLVTREGLGLIHERLEGLGYVPPFEGSKNLRDAETGVKIEFLVTGDYPGDGKPKPVAFPDPANVSEAKDGMLFVDLPTLIELKLASGMTHPDRMKDLADVQELIKLLGLSADFGDRLHPYVQGKFKELAHGTQQRRRRYLLAWRAPDLRHAANIGDLSRQLADAAARLEELRADGVSIEGAFLVTDDPEVARKHGMHDEAEFLREPPTT